jgi:hypothetical protein
MASTVTIAIGDDTRTAGALAAPRGRSYRPEATDRPASLPVVDRSAPSVIAARRPRHHPHAATTPPPSVS